MAASQGFADYFGIGVSCYSHYSDVDHAATDCVRFGKTLQRIGLLRTMWAVTDARSVADAAPLRNQVFSEAQRFLQSVDRQLPKIFYFAGHGITLNNALRICPRDYDPSVAERSSIDVSELIVDFSLHAPWTLFVLDCCRSWPKTERGRLQSVQESASIRTMDNSIVLFACSHREDALEATMVTGEPHGVGVFTHHLISVLRKCFRETNRVAVAEVFERARDETSRFVTLAAGTSQVPRMFGAHGGDYFLVRPSRRRSRGLSVHLKSNVL
jgi:uncharacterized caspase-like protein